MCDQQHKPHQLNFHTVDNHSMMWKTMQPTDQILQHLKSPKISAHCTMAAMSITGTQTHLCSYIILYTAAATASSCNLVGCNSITVFFPASNMTVLKIYQIKHTKKNKIIEATQSDTSNVTKIHSTYWWQRGSPRQQKTWEYQIGKHPCRPLQSQQHERHYKISKYIYKTSKINSHCGSLFKYH